MIYKKAVITSGDRKDKRYEFKFNINIMEEVLIKIFSK
jgi:hypothetical protein